MKNKNDVLFKDFPFFLNFLVHPQLDFAQDKYLSDIFFIFQKIFVLKNYVKIAFLYIIDKNIVSISTIFK